MTRPIDTKTSLEFNKKAYEKFLEGTRNQDPHSIARLLESESALREALELSPNYGRAMAELAYTLVLKADSRNFAGSEDKVLDEAEELTQMALDLDGDHDYAPHWTHGFLKIKKLAYSEGIAAFARAEKLFWNNTDTTERRSGLMMEFAEALTDAHTFGNLDSHDKVVNRKRKKISPIKKAVEIVNETLRHPDWYYWVAAYVYSEATEEDDHLNVALNYLDQMKYKPGEPGFLLDSLILKAQILERLGDHDAADDAMDKWLKWQKDRMASEQKALNKMDVGSMNLRNVKALPDTNDASHEAAANRIIAELSELGKDPNGETPRIKAWRDSLRTVLDRKLEEFDKLKIPIGSKYRK